MGNSRRIRRPYPGLSALDKRGDVYLGLSPQAGIGRTVGAEARGAFDPIPARAQTIEPRFVWDSRVALESAGHRPSTIPAWGDNPRFSYPTHAEG